MTIITFEVLCVPIAEPRKRSRVAANASGKSFVMNFTPRNAPVNDFKFMVRETARLMRPGEPPLEGPLMVVLTFVLPRPASMIWKKRPMPRVPHDKKPDADNLAKSTLDALCVLWRDDAQVADLQVKKLIAAGDETPKVTVYVATWDVGSENKG